MKLCLNCNSSIDSTKKFCNSSCSATYNNRKRKLSDDTKSKISNSLRARDEVYVESENAKSGRKRAAEKRRKDSIEILMIADFEELSLIRKKKRVRIEQDGKCIICNISEWLGTPITLEVDHIDGDNSNNSRENLRALCPNCHSQTETWRGANHRKVKIDDEKLIDLIKESKSIREVIIKSGMSVSSHSYKRINLLIEKHKLSLY